MRARTIRGATGRARAGKRPPAARLPIPQAVGRTYPALAWLGFAFGVSALLAPRFVARVMGMGSSIKPGVIRAVGLREAATGIGMLAQPRAARWRWARTAGDVMDLALHGYALASGRSSQGRLALSTAGLLALMGLDFAAAGSATPRRVR